MKRIYESFMHLSVGLKILITFTLLFFIVGSYSALNMINGNKTIEVTVQAETDIHNIPEDVVVQMEEEVIVIAKEAQKEEKEKEEEKKEEKKVKYKNKEITIPKAQVAATNSKEDAQKEKTGGEQISAADAVDKFENDGQSVGIDVSKHQEKINWKAVKESGIEFAMIRCGFRGQTEGKIYEDAYFKTNVKSAVANGIKVGIYFYSCAINEEEALQEAAWVVNAIQSYRITYPVVYDFEDFGKYRCAGVSKEQATANAIAFLEYVKNAGYTPMMYASKNDITNNFNRTKLSGYKFWLAHYTTTTNYTGSYQMWQYTSNGTVDGIRGRVDMNIAYFRYGAVAEPKHTHDFDNGTEIKTNDSKLPTCEIEGVKYIRCASCSESKKVTVKALGHEYGEWVIEKKATEDEDGLKYRICEVCKEKEEKVISKLVNKNNTVNNTTSNVIGNITGNNVQNTVGDHTHNYVHKSKPSTCKEKGKTWEECTCGDIVNEKEKDLEEHTYGDVLIKEDGTNYKKCNVCGDELVIENQGKPPIVTP